MATYDQPIIGTATQQVHGHSYQNINSSDNARVHVGDVHVYEDPLKHLPFASKAPFNAYHRQYDSDCLPGTREAVLEKIYEWIEGDEKSCIFWLSGWPGTGKSAIARTVARRYHARGHLAASFFFVRGGGECSRAGLFVTSIAQQLVDNEALGMEQIIRAAFDRQILTHTLQDQWTQLIIQPLSRYDEKGDGRTLLIVVDALDECEEEGSIGILLRSLPRVAVYKNLRVKILVTSRPETRVRHGFKLLGESSHHAFVLHDISSDIVNRDIQVFLEHRFLEIAAACDFPNSWPGAEIIECMVELAGGLFIWADTACKFVEEDPFLAEGRLDSLTNRIGDTLPEPQRQLDQIYTTILSASVPNTCSQLEKERIYDHLRLLLGAITTLFSTLSAGSLSKMLDVPLKVMLSILSRLHSILDFGEEPTRSIRLHHDSFRDFLSSEKRCLDSRLFVDKKKAHARLVTRCIEVMSSVLKENICGQDGLGVPASDVSISHVQQCLPPEAQYACLYWVRHLTSSGQRLLDNGDMHQFLRDHALHWMEAMSWMGKTSEAIEAMTLLGSISGGEDCKTSQDLVQECKRFLMYARSGIEQAPLQVYVAAALFAPSKTVLREVGGKTKLVSYVKRSPPTPEHWSTLLLTLVGHSSAVNAVQFSQDGSKLASASHDNKVMVWNPSTGEHLHTLEGHSDWVNAVQFSQDGSKLASASDDNKVMVWNPSTGEHLHTLEGHSGAVNAVQFSQDGSKLASASHDNKVMVWNPSTGAHLHTLEGHSGAVSAVQFSPDGSKLASASWDSKVKVWDASTGAHLHTLEGHSGPVSAVQFSPDGSKLASASMDNKVKVWDLNTTLPIQTIDVKEYVTNLAFSPDGLSLNANIGSSKLGLGVGNPHDENSCTFHLRVAEDWILRHGHRTIWLPPEFRGHAHAMSVVGVMALGCSSGSVSFWEIEE